MAIGFIDPIQTIYDNIEKVMAVPSYLHELKPYQIDEISKLAKTKKRRLLKKYGLDESMELSLSDFTAQAESMPSIEDCEEWVNANRIQSLVEPPKIERQKGTGKESQRCYALYYFYLQKAGLYPDFTDGGQTKEKSIQELTAKLIVSAQRFEQVYNKVSTDQKERTNPGFIKDLIRAIQLLAENPEHEAAKAIAQDELNIAASKKR